MGDGGEDVHAAGAPGGAQAGEDADGGADQENREQRADRHRQAAALGRSAESLEDQPPPEQADREATDRAEGRHDHRLPADHGSELGPALADGP